MRVLLIKTSSMGDVIHTLPALTDAGNMLHDVQFDWIVEDAFKEIPTWHPLVNRVIPIQLRKWRKTIFSKNTRVAIKKLYRELNAQEYDVILDAQGLVKSAWLTLFARGERVGLDFSSARESFASLFYQRKCTVNFKQHAVTRARQLFSEALHYSLPNTLPQFNLQKNIAIKSHKPYLVFLHGTTWESKLWPENYWSQLAKIANQHQLQVKISGASEAEIARANRIAQSSDNVSVLPKLTINAMSELLTNSMGAIAVDTGFGHLASALSIPTVSLYGATNPLWSGAIGENALHLTGTFECSPCLKRTCSVRATEITPACFQALTPEIVWRRFRAIAKF